MKVKISYFFILGLMAWLSVFILRKIGIIIPYVNDYFTDIITLPMYCYLIEWLITQVFMLSWKPSLQFLFTSFLYISLLFEVCCPMISDLFVGDFYDIFAYFLGGIVYYVFKIRKQQNHLLFS